MLTLFISNRHRQGMLTLFISNNNFQTSNSAIVTVHKLLMSGLVLVYMGILQTGGSVCSVALGFCVALRMRGTCHVLGSQWHP